MAKLTVEQAVNLMADHAQELGADSNDERGIVRSIVSNHGLGFEAWLLVCCEIADRKAQQEGYKDQCDRAGKKMQQSQAYKEYIQSPGYRFA